MTAPLRNSALKLFTGAGEGPVGDAGVDGGKVLWIGSPFRPGGGGSGTPISSISPACFGGFSASCAAASRKLIGADFVTGRCSGCTGVRGPVGRGACCAEPLPVMDTIINVASTAWRMRFILVVL